MEEEARKKEPAPVDPADLALGHVLRQYPVGKLLGVIAAVLVAGFGGGYWLRDKLQSEELRHCKDEYGVLEKSARTLQQALNSGQCAKSEVLMQRDEARRLLGRLEIAVRGFDRLRSSTLNGSGPRGVAMEADYWTSIDLGRFFDDPKVADLVTDLNMATLKFNESLYPAFGAERYLEAVKDTDRQRQLKGQPPQDTSGQKDAIALLNSRYDEVQAALVATREYMTAKYATPAGPAEHTGR